MRHIYINLATYIIAAWLIVGSLVFAWLRSEQVVLSDEQQVLTVYETATTLDEFAWARLGALGYATNCANCHGAEGQGWDAYPPLRGQGFIFNQPGGREYLIDVMLYGLASDRTTAPMPPLHNMPDSVMAATLNHMLTHWGNGGQLEGTADLYLPADIAARRGQNVSPWDVNDRRPLP